MYNIVNSTSSPTSIVKYKYMKAGVDYIGISTVFICHDGAGNFLLHKRSNNCRDEQGRWDFGGGQLHFGETLEEGVLREVREEYGVVGKIEKQFPAHSLLRVNNGIKTHWLIINFIIRVIREKVKINDKKKMEEIGWYKMNNLPKPLHSGAEYTRSKYKQEFMRYIK